MKRFLVIVTIALLFIPFINVQKSHAYTGGLLDGKEMIFSGSIGGAASSTTTLVTDNNEATHINVGPYNSPTNAYLYYHFPTSQTISSFKIASDANNQVTVILLDENKNVLYSLRNPWGTPGTTRTIPEKSGVRYVSLYADSVNAAPVYDFDVFAPVDTTPPVKPSGLNATPSNGKVDLTWIANTDDSNLDGYNVYKNGVKVNGSLIKTNSYTVYGVANDNTFYWKVTAVSKAGIESMPSDQVSTLWDTTSPLAPIGLAVNGKTSSVGMLDHVMLTWVANTEPNLAGYNVYRESNTKLNDSLLTVTYYEVTGLTENVTYDFSITAVGTNHNESPRSASVSYVYDTIPPNPPSNVQGVGDNESAIISYTASNSPDVASYRIYRDGIVIANITGHSYTDSGLTNGQLYTYQVSALDIAGNESIKSVPVVVTPSLPKTKPNAPVKLSVTPRNGGLDATWTSSPNATSYNVYLDGEKVTTKTGTSHQFTGLMNDTAYTVDVTAVNSLGESSKVSTSGKPTTKAMPIMSLGYSLSDVASGVGDWFGGIWMILAFSLSIPLAFYVGQRAKGLFD